MSDQGGEKVEAGHGGRVEWRRVGARPANDTGRSRKGRTLAPQQPGPELQAKADKEASSKPTVPGHLAGSVGNTCDSLSLA